MAGIIERITKDVVVDHRHWPDNPPGHIQGRLSDNELNHLIESGQIQPPSVRAPSESVEDAAQRAVRADLELSQSSGAIERIVKAATRVGGVGTMEVTAEPERFGIIKRALEDMANRPDLTDGAQAAIGEAMWAVGDPPAEELYNQPHRMEVLRQAIAKIWHEVGDSKTAEALEIFHEGIGGGDLRAEGGSLRYPPMTAGVQGGTGDAQPTSAPGGGNKLGWPGEP